MVRRNLCTVYIFSYPSTKRKKKTFHSGNVGKLAVVTVVSQYYTYLPLLPTFHKDLTKGIEQNEGTY